ncbi:maternal effect embryo arrest 18, partial [Tanacetum coccineum]
MGCLSPQGKIRKGQNSRGEKREKSKLKGDFPHRHVAGDNHIVAGKDIPTPCPCWRKGRNVAGESIEIVVLCKAKLDKDWLNVLLLDQSSSLILPIFCWNISIQRIGGLVSQGRFYTKGRPFAFQGGTAFNGVVEELKKLTTSVAHVLPVSDDGGSTAEIVRVLGGPAVGDIRSRCLRLSDQSTSEALAVRTLLGFRLPLDARQAKLEWYSIVEGEHPLWKDVSKPYRETIRAFLAYFQNQIIRRTNESFSFSNGSIGNFFFAGARIFFQSLDAAIFLFSRVSQIPTESLVLPVISTNDRLTLGCELWDGTIIRGQNEISHPTSGSLQLIDKVNSSALPSMIKRVFPNVNPSVLEQLRNVDCIIYGMGSLFTSICPSLVLLGVGEIISSRSCAKVLLLNGTYDRETSGFSSSCFVTAITDALNRTYGHLNNSLKNNVTESIYQHYFCAKDGQIPVDIKSLAAQGIVHV